MIPTASVLQGHLKCGGRESGREGLADVISIHELWFMECLRYHLVITVYVRVSRSCTKIMASVGSAVYAICGAQPLLPAQRFRLWDEAASPTELCHQQRVVAV